MQVACYLIIVPAGTSTCRAVVRELAHGTLKGALVAELTLHLEIDPLLFWAGSFVELG